VVEPGDFVDVARRTEESGCESAFIWDHLVYPKGYRSRYPYSRDGTPPFPDTRAYDGWMVLGHIAAAASRIRLCTNVYILPLRNPFVTASEA
jgi:alkanesulfonate monooxygenase SsuD/methylene tetrahydromethanopterin reductase-like flavin-dependent oxidoreductase (luciferase family)